MARAIASVTVSFGLVSIPVKIYSPIRSDAAVRFKMLRGSDNSRLKQQYIAVNDGEVVGRKEMVKGFEYAKDRFVVMSDEEVKEAQAAATKAIETQEFIPISAIDTIYFDKPYYLGPDKGGDKPYHLLKTAMMQSGLAGIAQYAARGKAYLVLVRATDEGLLMQQLRYSDEVRPFSEVPMGDETEVRDAELALALQIIAMSTSEKFSPENYEDTVRHKLEQAIQRKIDGQEVSVSHEEEPKAQLIDLMAALKASLAGTAAPEASDGFDTIEQRPVKRAATAESDEDDQAKTG